MRRPFLTTVFSENMIPGICVLNFSDLFFLFVSSQILSTCWSTPSHPLDGRRCPFLVQPAAIDVFLPPIFPHGLKTYSKELPAWETNNTMMGTWEGSKYFKIFVSSAISRFPKLIRVLGTCYSITYSCSRYYIYCIVESFTVMDKFIFRDNVSANDGKKRDELNCEGLKKRKTATDTIPSEQLVKKWCSLFKWVDVEWKNKMPYLRCQLCVTARKSNVLASDKGKWKF